MKKILKIIGIFFAIILVVLALSPLFLKGTLEKLVKKTIDNNLNATVAWNDFDLSLFRSFPDAALTIKDFSVINRAPFEGDTLAAGEFVKIDMGITQLFKSGDDPILVDALTFDKTFVNILIDSTGNANYDIAIKKDAPLTDDIEGNSGFTFDLKKYEITNSRINYLDAKTKTFLMLKEVNHEGTGDFSLAQSELDTKTNALVSLRIDDIEYLKENSVALDAIFQLDLENQKYTFLENEAKVNELPLTFDGFVKVNEENNEIDLAFKTPSSDFKNFLAVIPKTYVKELDGVTTTGNFTVNGSLKGIIDDTYIPKMDIAIKSDNASFKYPDLPKAVRNISIDASLKNETGLLKDTFITIGDLSFKIDEELFTANGSIRNLTENALVNLALKGTINLANIEKVLPLEMEQQLSGIFKADVNTNFDMNSVENEQYQNIKTTGSASITHFSYKDASFKDEIKVSSANITMSPGNNIKLTNLAATTGTTDLQATGDIVNLIPWIMAKQDLKGSFNVQSNTFNLNDFKEPESSLSETNTSASKTAAKKEDAIKIPDFLDATLNFTANKVVYDNITLNNVKGTARVREETASLNNVTSDIFGGNIALSGNVSTKNVTPTFAMDLDLSKIDIAQSFTQLEILKYIAPIANALNGDINTTLKLNGELNENLTPKLSSLVGSGLARIITAEVDPQKAPLLSKLGDKVAFLNIDRLSLRDVSTALTFNNGKIEVKPFDFNVKGVKITASGSHGLDKTIDYNLSMDVPARYLGGEVTKLLSKLDPGDAENMSVALPIGIKGTLSSPNISVNTEAAVKTLTQKLIYKQKQELKDKGTNILEDLIGQGNNTTKPKDSTNASNPDPKGTQQNTTQVVKDILGGLFGKNKKETDSTGKGG
ncbi:AsmA-like C-terminal region-containing protein [Constantimarinum furrinae]|uniref:Membrane protein n=1 Tax=Constantimarinum furrinae TaxID=2562285 RepID=A0A7G8PU58_9FLAO|nr:AsmA-like C-terminal region-containing protein [Constantimarinum furrinae]QNJ97874.1 membrane protein [Constantimarinum furrinae]